NAYAVHRLLKAEKIKTQLIQLYINRYFQILERFFRELLYSVTFGYIYKFKFESRLYRTRYQYTSFVFRLGLAHKVNYCLPLNLRLNDNDRKQDRKSTRLNSSHVKISYAVF